MSSSSIEPILLGEIIFLTRTLESFKLLLFRLVGLCFKFCDSALRRFEIIELLEIDEAACQSVMWQLEYNVVILLI